MITTYARRNGALAAIPFDPGQTLPDDVIWIDLLTPNAAEEHAVEEALHLALPTREEMGEIELSNRLYMENGASYLTATLLTRADTETPESEPVTFVLVGHRLVTIRYADPLPITAFIAQVQRQAPHCTSGEAILAELLDAVTDRLADILEKVQQDTSEITRVIFARDAGKVDFEDVLRKIGLAQSRTSRARESLVSIGRLLSFQTRPGDTKPNKVMIRSFKTLSRDVISLSDHATFLTTNINFLLDATLGKINIEQTGIIKIFSVAATVFLPPTLIASIYGMNFAHMPELGWKVGYPVSIGLMILSAALPLYFFKRKGWL
ncbi:MAG: magnesium transporter CorA family protein [Hyphomicrobiales bacterium]|nr:magnesium transporter CorA family protein [Hyphomicrobiales bacterium]